MEAVLLRNPILSTLEDIAAVVLALLSYVVLVLAIILLVAYTGVTRLVRNQMAKRQRAFQGRTPWVMRDRLVVYAQPRQKPIDPAAHDSKDGTKALET